MSTKKIVLGCLGVIALGLLGFAGCTALGIAGFGKAVEDAKNAPGGSKATAVGMGTAVKNGDLVFTVTAAKDAGPKLTETGGMGTSISAATGGTYVLVTYTVKNDGKASGAISKPTLIDEQDRRYSHTVAFGDYVPKAEACTLETVPAGLSQTCTDIYEVPADHPVLYAQCNGFGMNEGWVKLDIAAP